MFSFLRLKFMLTAAVTALALQSGQAQTMMPLPNHASVYTGSIRGFWFTAPVDFVITGLRVPSQAGTGTQNIQVIKINDATPVVYSTTSTNFTSLHITYGATNGVIQNVNIPITAGDKIGVLGTAGTGNSYGTVTSQSNIDGIPVTLARMGYQGNMPSTGIPNYWTEPSSSSISRVEVYYNTCSTAIDQHPIATTTCEGEQANFSASAVDGNVFKWQVDEGSGFVNVINGANYAGATTNTLSTVNTPFSFNDNKYRALVYKSATSTSCADTSNDVRLTVKGLVKPDNLPAFDTTCIHSTKDIEIKATGSITGYRWQMFITGTGYVDVPQQAPFVHMGNILQIADVPDTLDGVKFRCLVDGLCDTATSTEMLLSVSLVPTVVVPPADVTADPGDEVTFEVQASGTGARYEWQVAAPDTFVIINDGGIYSGVKTSKLTVKGVSRAQNNFRFRCLIRSSAAVCTAPGDTSDFAVLYVNPAASVGMLGKDGEMTLYPNPVKGNELYIQTGSITGNNLKYKITDKLGKTISIGNISNNGKTKIEVGQLPADIYMVEIQNANGSTIINSRFTKL